MWRSRCCTPLTATLGRERFLREIAIAARLTHPHILALHDSGEAESRLFYAMPYVEGESLRQWLEREGQLAVAEVIEIVRAVAAAPNYLARARLEDAYDEAPLAEEYYRQFLRRYDRPTQWQAHLVEEAKAALSRSEVQRSPRGID